ncbi:hypothetical protein RSSM_03495 [Rhodopirellula sallentina SM41]|uniref:Uncharacterized protein n=1 Tax=Rhodopirellula sallentina SM41 TaxID=1263870 RepID=M5U0S9_9BACT|nr:hypothetical protein RSSM_03495 [Rhodopirellula sallentina SM41]
MYAQTFEWVAGNLEDNHDDHHDAVRYGAGRSRTSFSNSIRKLILRSMLTPVNARQSSRKPAD